MKSLTIAIASYQRRAHLVRLLTCLATQLADEPDVQVVVVLDGSTDGSAEAAERFGFDVRWQPNRGLAATRNAGLAAATGDIIWFLDDDLEPAGGVLRRHRLDHEVAEPHLLLGPCHPSPELDASPQWVAWWSVHYDRLASAGKVERFDQFTVANLSGPTAVFRSFDGFDEQFRDYGLEDYELGVRVLEAGVPVHFDADAVAWHHHAPDMAKGIGRRRGEGRNTARLVLAHRETATQLFTDDGVDVPTRVLQRIPSRSPVVFSALSRAAALIGLHGPAFLGRLRLVALRLAWVAAYAAGVADIDPTLVPAALGRQRGAR